MDSPARENPLDSLLAAQGYTKEMLALLSKRLSPVSSPSTRVSDGKVAAEGSGLHINTALSNQYSINDQLAAILDEMLL